MVRFVRLGVALASDNHGRRGRRSMGDVSVAARTHSTNKCTWQWMILVFVRVLCVSVCFFFVLLAKGSGWAVSLSLCDVVELMSEKLLMYGWATIME